MKKEITKDITNKDATELDLYLSDAFADGFYLDEFIEKLIHLNDNLKNFGYSKVRISLDSGYNNISNHIIANRLETDKEEQSRIERSNKAKLAAKKRKENKEAKERDLLEKLQEKYNKK